MPNRFIHLTHPGSVIAAARRLGLSSQAICRAGRTRSDKAFEEDADPDLDSILDEMEAQRSDDGEFDTFLDRIGSGMEARPMADEEDAGDENDDLDIDDGETPDADDSGNDEVGDAAADLAESDIFLGDRMDDSEGCLPLLREETDGHAARVIR